MTDTSNNQRIAKNTLFMYLRMLITMACGLFMSRLVLRSLGIDDYGLYNVIGGIIAMFSFLNGAMTNTTSRYITFYLGKNDRRRLSNVFSMSVIIHLCIALIVTVFGETIGLWYVYNKLIVNPERFRAAFWLYQLSVANMIVSILYIPYNSIVVAHEKMSAVAYVSILDAIIKLVIAISLNWVTCDKLIYFGTMMFLVSVIDFIIYFVYCRQHFSESKFHLFWESSLFKNMFEFAGWSLFGNFSYIFYSQGINLILNAFCGPAVNAARGIAIQVEGVVRQFASNVQTALNPQIIKSYADNNLNRTFSLIFVSSRYCFYLLLLLALPLVIESKFVLDIWLGDYPDHTVNFMRITLISVILDGMINPLFTANLASGKVKLYQITISILDFTFMPITYWAMKYSHAPESVFFCLLFLRIIELAARVFVVSHQIGMSKIDYLTKVVCPNIKVTLWSIILPITLYLLLDNNGKYALLIMAVSIISVILSCIFGGMTKNERNFAFNKIKSLLSR